MRLSPAPRAIQCVLVNRRPRCTLGAGGGAACKGRVHVRSAVMRWV